MNHKDLDAWKQPMELVENIYRVTASLPKEETYGLAAQLRRAAISIPSNISEGSGRRSNREFMNFLNISLGSVAEVETQLLIAEMPAQAVLIFFVLRIMGQAGVIWV